MTKRSSPRTSLAASPRSTEKSSRHAKLPACKKHAILQKTEDEQVKHLVETKGAFSTGAQWCTFGFKLLGSRAIIRAQTLQLEAERKDSKEARATKLGDKKAKAEKARQALIVFNSKSGEKAKGDDWKDIIKFILPIYEPGSAPSKFSTIAKAKAKLEEIENKKGKAWTVLVEEEVNKVLSELESEVAQLEDATAVSRGPDIDPDALDGDADSAADEAPKGDPEVQAEC